MDPINAMLGGGAAPILVAGGGRPGAAADRALADQRKMAEALAAKSRERLNSGGSVDPKIPGNGGRGKKMDFNERIAELQRQWDERVRLSGVDSNGTGTIVGAVSPQWLGDP